MKNRFFIWLKCRKGKREWRAEWLFSTRGAHCSTICVSGKFCVFFLQQYRLTYYNCVDPSLYNSSCHSYSLYTIRLDLLLYRVASLFSLCVYSLEHKERSSLISAERYSWIGTKESFPIDDRNRRILFSFCVCGRG